MCSKFLTRGDPKPRWAAPVSPNEQHTTVKELAPALGRIMLVACLLGCFLLCLLFVRGNLPQIIRERPRRALWTPAANMKQDPRHPQRSLLVAKAQRRRQKWCPQNLCTGMKKPHCSEGRAGSKPVLLHTARPNGNKQLSTEHGSV